MQERDMGQRDDKGRFVKGVSGNPGGRTPLPEELKLAARGMSVKALNVLQDALNDEDPRVRIVAANSILERAYGKPAATEKPEGGGNNSQAHIAALLALASASLGRRGITVIEPPEEA
jgi:hypothetical protein